MATKLPELREAVRISLGDDAASPTVFTDDDAIDIWLRQGIRVVSRKRPLYTNTPLTPVDGQVRYDAPARIKTLLRVVKLYSAGSTGEYEYEAVYEPAQGKIHLTDTGDFSLPSGEDLTVEYTAEYIVPTDDNTDTDVPDKFLDAVRLYAVAEGLKWQARQILSQNQGVISFTVGRYAEKGTDPIKTLRNEAKECMAEMDEILGTNEPGIEFSRGNSSTTTRRAPSLTGAVHDEHGWTGEEDLTYMRTNAPGGTQ